MVDSGASKTSTPHKSDFVELHPLSGLVVDDNTEDCSIEGKAIGEFTAVAEDGTEISLRDQAHSV